MTIARLSFDATALVSRHPPRFSHAKKKMLFDLIAPSQHRGVIEVARYPVMDLPEEYVPTGAALEAEANTFPYSPDDATHWWLNFAHHDLFAFYGGPLFAQDEIQVAEHPALASLREALIDSPLRPMTVQQGLPTPILIRGVERCAAIDARTIYGQRFASASAGAIESAVQRIDPPTRSSILAIEAPYGSTGRYTSLQIESVIETAFTGFTAAIEETPGAIIHTGFWGCGAYGGNRILMPMLQIAAARMARIPRLVFHGVDAAGVETFATARTRLDALAPRTISLGKLIGALTAEGFEWGVSDGN